MATWGFTSATVSILIYRSALRLLGTTEGGGTPCLPAGGGGGGGWGGGGG